MEFFNFFDSGFLYFFILLIVLKIFNWLDIWGYIAFFSLSWIWGRSVVATDTIILGAIVSVVFIWKTIRYFVGFQDRVKRSLPWEILFTKPRVAELLAVPPGEVLDISALMAEDHIDMEVFIANFSELVEMPLLPHILECRGASSQSMSAAKECISVYNYTQIKFFPFWFISAYPDVVAWYFHQPKEKREDIDYCCCFNEDKKDLKNEFEMYSSKYLRILINQFKRETNSSLELDRLAA